jgi:hypothetical protein
MLLHKEPSAITARFLTFDRLKEVDYGHDTNVNESFNNTFSWLAPKNKKYCGTGSLSNRIAIGIGVTSLGLVDYFKCLFEELEIAVTPNILHFLEVKERRWQ